MIVQGLKPGSFSGIYPLFASPPALLKSCPDTNLAAARIESRGGLYQGTEGRPLGPVPSRAQKKGALALGNEARA